MGKIDEGHGSLIEEVGLCYAASASSDGVPNVSPKGSITVLDDDHLAFADIMSPGTRKKLDE
jgi:predicted pyridoxine 5'-phosphate oxidase superfamily flavin-nucleotide-binding protein